MKNRRNLLILLSVVAIWGTSWASMKIGLSYTTPTSYLWQRMLFSTLMMAPFLLLHRGRAGKRELRVAAFASVSALTWIFSQILMMSGLGSTSSGMSSILTYTQPLFVFGISALFRRDAFTRLKATGVLLGFFGIGMIYEDSFGNGIGSTQAVILLLLGGFLWAVSILSYKLVSDVVSPFWMVFIEFAFGSVLVLPFALVAGGIYVSLELPYILSLAYTTAFSAVAAYLLWFYLLKNEDTVTVSSSSMLVPLVAFGAGAVLLREEVNLNQTIGIAMVLTGVYLVNRQAKREKVRVDHLSLRTEELRRSDIERRTFH